MRGCARSVGKEKRTGALSANDATGAGQRIGRSPGGTHDSTQIMAARRAEAATLVFRRGDHLRWNTVERVRSTVGHTVVRSLDEAQAYGAAALPVCRRVGETLTPVCVPANLTAV